MNKKKIVFAVILAVLLIAFGVSAFMVGRYLLDGKKQAERNEQLQQMVFGGYNKEIQEPRTPCDWLTRDEEIVDAYVEHPLCGFTPACGLLRDMMKGIYYIQQDKNLKNMKKHLPVFFIAGGEDPVGPYGKGVEKAVKEFK